MPRSRPAYQREPIELRDRVWRAGRIDAWSLLQILAWKSANGNLAWLSLETPENIAAVSERSLAAIADYKDAVAADLAREPGTWKQFIEATREALDMTTGLRSLHGVALPSATAILAILNPRLWPVLDRWATVAVWSNPPDAVQRLNFATYKAYLDCCVALQREGYPNLTIHEVDQQLMNIGKYDLDRPFATATRGPVS